MKRAILMVCLSALVAPAQAWEGQTADDRPIALDSYDAEEQTDGNIEYYDHDTDEYRDAYIDVHPDGTATITDDESGESFDIDFVEGMDPEFDPDM